MEKNIKIYTLSILAFLCILSVSGSFDGILGDSLYFLAFIIPFAFSFFAAKENKTVSYLKTKPKNISLLIYATPIILISIFALSYLTAWLIFVTTGTVNPPETSSSFFNDVINLALSPAILEEALFRYIPLLLIAPYSKKSALVISSLYFALVHMSFFSIPYALAAGVAFMLIDIAAGSIWPSVILHFVNNFISILWEYSLLTDARYIFIALFAAAALVSLVFIIIMRKKYLSAIKAEFEKSDKFTLPALTLTVVIPTVLIAFINLLY